MASKNPNPSPLPVNLAGPEFPDLMKSKSPSNIESIFNVSQSNSNTIANANSNANTIANANPNANTNANTNAKANPEAKNNTKTNTDSLLPTELTNVDLELEDLSEFPDDGVDYTAEEVNELLEIGSQIEVPSQGEQMEEDSKLVEPEKSKESRSMPPPASPKNPPPNTTNKPNTSRPHNIPPLMSIPTNQPKPLVPPTKTNYAGVTQRNSTKVEHILHVYSSRERKSRIEANEWQKIENYLLGLQESELLKGNAGPEQIRIAYAGYDNAHSCGIVAAKSQESAEWHQEAIRRYPIPHRAWGKGEQPELYTTRIYLPTKYDNLRHQNIIPILKKMNPFLSEGILEIKHEELVEKKGGTAIYIDVDRVSFQQIKSNGWRLEFLMGDVDCTSAARDPRAAKKMANQPPLPTNEKGNTNTPKANTTTLNTNSSKQPASPFLDFSKRLQNLPTTNTKNNITRTGANAILPANAAAKASPDKPTAAIVPKSRTQSPVSSTSDSDSDNSIRYREAKLEKSGKLPSRKKSRTPSPRHRRRSTASPDKRRRSPDSPDRRRSGHQSRKGDTGRSSTKEHATPQKRGREESSLEKSTESDRHRPKHKKNKKRH